MAMNDSMVSLAMTRTSLTLVGRVRNQSVPASSSLLLMLLSISAAYSWSCTLSATTSSLRCSNSLSCCTIRCGSGTQQTCATAGGAGLRVVVLRPAFLDLDPSSASAAKAQLEPCNAIT
uniref:Uncharacterized protein n=1 Tax=Setaria italica TaxID=4555 RepID=K3Y029_SETIT